MGRLFWPLALVAMFVIGWTARGVLQDGTPTAPAGDASREAARVQQANALQAARTRARESSSGARPSTTTGSATADYSVASASPANRSYAAGFMGDRPSPDRFGRGPGGPPPPNAGSPQPRGATGPQTIESALERFYRYVDATGGADGRENWQRGRELT